MQGCLAPSVKFSLNYGKGQINVTDKNLWLTTNMNRNEFISIKKATVIFKNLIMGTLYMDMDGVMTGYNHNTGDRVDITYFQKGSKKNSYIEGKLFDKKGKQRYSISGSYLD